MGCLEKNKGVPTTGEHELGGGVVMMGCRHRGCTVGLNRRGGPTQSGEM